MVCLGVLKYTFVYVTCRRNRVSIRSDLLPALRMNICRTMFWNTKAKVPRSLFAVTSMPGLRSPACRGTRLLENGRSAALLAYYVDEDELPDYTRQRRNKDLLAPGSQTWGPELLGFCQQADLLILNGRTLRDEYGHFTFENTKGCCSTIDYFVASAECFSVVKSLHVLDDAARYNSDYNPLLLHIAYKAPCDTHTHTHSHLICSIRCQN